MIIMRASRTFASSSLFVALLLLVVACSDATSPSPSSRAVARVTLAADTVATGDTVQLHATAYDAAGTAIPDVSFSWQSSDTAVAAFNDQGLLVGRSRGTVQVTVSPLASGSGGAGGGTPTATATIAVRLAFAQITGGTYHTCGVARSGVAYCWGMSDWGRLGNGAGPAFSDPVRTPARVLANARFGSIAGDRQHDSMSGHSCAVATDGTVYCWGSGAWGMLGDGQHGEDIPPYANPTPTRVDGLPSVQAAALGGKHTCVLATDGTAWCAGANGGGQIGVVSAPGSCPELGYAEECALQFTQVSGGHVFAQLSAGAYHTCGLTADGEAWCWGSADFGQLGSGTSGTFNPLPLAVTGGLHFRSLSAGGLHTCGITTDGVAYCWGYNYFGQLGLGSWGGIRKAPVAVASTVDFAHVYTGEEHTCALTDDGTAYCWGLNEHGQLGATTSGVCGDSTLQNTVVSSCSMVPVLVQTSLRFTMLALGWDHTCGLTANGETYCWGSNASGQLGTGTTTDSSVPVKVVDME